jgi:nucleoside phosphorylase
MPYDLAAIRELVNAALGDEELSILCFDIFREVHEKFAAGQSRTARIQMLIEHVERHGLHDQLLAEVKKINPRRYAAMAPRLIAGPDSSQSKDTEPQQSLIVDSFLATGKKAPILHIDEIRGKVDVGIITIREDEFLAVLKRLQDRSPVHGGRQLYDFAQVTSRNGDKLGVAVARCLEQGQGDAQSVAWEAIDDLNPPWLFLVGIAGGIPHGDYSLGDVVLASRLNDFSVSAAIQDQPPEFNVGGGPMHPEVENLLRHLPALTEAIKAWNQQRSIGMQKPVVVIPENLSASSYYGSEDWKRSVQTSLRTNFPAGKRVRAPKVLISPMISTNTLVKDADLARQWQQSARHTSAVEMELGGVYRAARRGGQRDYRVVAIRGISDIVGFKRSGDWTTYACHSAAAFACALLRSGVLQLVQSSRHPQ